MRVAWVTHRDIFSRSGGAEMTDDDMLARRPEDVEVMLIRPGGVDTDLKDFDRVVVTGLWGYSEKEVSILGKCAPIVWAHDAQLTGHWLYSQASKFIALNQAHLDLEMENREELKKRDCYINPGWFDTSLFQYNDHKHFFALWAHRLEWHKGLHNAQRWADENQVPLVVMHDRPIEEVAKKMSVAKYFVLLSDIFDAGPLAVTQAQISGCELVVENVGMLHGSPDEVRSIVDEADKSFWRLVCE